MGSHGSSIPLAEKLCRQQKQQKPSTKPQARRKFLERSDPAVEKEVELEEKAPLGSKVDGKTCIQKIKARK
jgi:hypothetical protein